jgi:hypothetical protein
MSESVRDVLAREAAEAEAVADAEDRGEVERKPGQRARQSREASQVYSLRLPADAIAQLRSIAERLNEAPTALLRRFILERLADEGSRAEPANAIASAVDDLLPLLRQRLLEAAYEMDVPAATTASDPGPRRQGVNLGPSRRGTRMGERQDISA